MCSSGEMVSMTICLAMNWSIARSKIFSAIAKHPAKGLCYIEAAVTDGKNGVVGEVRCVVEGCP